MGRAIGPHGAGPMRPDVCKEYKRETGIGVIEDSHYWGPCHKILLGNGIIGWENVGGDVDEVNGMMVAIVDEGDQ